MIAGVSKASLSLVGAVLVSLGLVVAAPACSSESEPTLGNTTKDGGSSGSAAADARRPYPSFRDDVVPLVQESCALTACHASKESNLGIFLAYDPAQIYAELKKVSATASGESFVVPGDPAKSYLMVKLEGKQGAFASKCANNNCGTVMPPDDPLPAAKLETVRKWITEGAKDN
jgi:hypothetical protein